MLFLISFFSSVFFRVFFTETWTIMLSHPVRYWKMKVGWRTILVCNVFGKLKRILYVVIQRVMRWDRTRIMKPLTKTYLLSRPIWIFLVGDLSLRYFFHSSQSFLYFLIWTRNYCLHKIEEFEWSITEWNRTI